MWVRGHTWKRHVAGNTAVDFFTVSLTKERSEPREKHARPDAGLPAAASPPPALPECFLPILERPVQLEGQVRISRGMFPRRVSNESPESGLTSF